MNYPDRFEMNWLGTTFVFRRVADTGGTPTYEIRGVCSFKPGDKVVYARSWEGSRLKPGVYTVKAYNQNNGILELMETPNDSFYAHRFDKV